METQGMAMTPGKKKRDYERIPPEVLDAIMDQMESRANGVVEIHTANGGIAKVYSTQKKTYK